MASQQTLVTREPQGSRTPETVSRSGDGSKSKSWRVIHACENAREVLPVIEAQLSAGMRPYIVTPGGAGTAEAYLSGYDPDQQRALSLLSAWQDVRTWRRSLLECDPETRADLVHAHAFSAGMAGVRNCSCVVYDLGACVEEIAISSKQCESGSWIGRSFRVAEQFILSRAAAVVVHSPGMKAAAEERGASLQSIFLVPEPLESEHMLGIPAADLPDWARNPDRGWVTFFAPQLALPDSTELSAEAMTILEAFTLVLGELPEARLLVALPSSANSALHGHTARLGIASHTSVIDPHHANAAFHAASVVIASGEIANDPVNARRTNDTCLKSLSFGRALLAADVPRNREASPDGHGCLWFTPRDVRDLSNRMIHLAQNRGFCDGLAAAGKNYMMETRGPAAIGRKYDSVYRYAITHKKPRGTGSGVTSLQPAAVW
jgi:hypothetical protein